MLEFVCKRCNGKGFLLEKFTYDNLRFSGGGYQINVKQLCKRCNGEGKHDWVSNVIPMEK